MNSAEVLIKFKGEDESATKTANSVKASIKQLVKDLIPLSVAAGAATIAVAKIGIEFERSMKNVQAISGATAKEMELLERKAREMNESTIFSAKESADALSYMALAGWKTEQMLEGLPGILNLAAAAGSDLARTSDIVTDGLTSFKMAAEESTRFADVMASTMSNSNTTVEELGEAFKYVAPVAGAMGYTIEDVSMALGLMSNSSVKASMAGTSLRSVMTRLAKPTDEVYEATRALGVSLTDSQGNMKSFYEIMVELRNGMSGLTETEKARYAAMIAGKQGMAGLLAITEATTEDFEKLTKATQGAAGSAQEIADIMNQSTGNQLLILRGKVEELALQFAEIMLPVLKDLVGFLQKVVDAMQELSPAGKKIIGVFTLILASIAPLATAVKIFKPIITIIQLIAGPLGKIMSLLVKIVPIIIKIGGVIVGTIGIVPIIIAAVIAAVVLLWVKCEWFRNGVIAIANAIWNAIKTAVSFIVNLVKTMITTIISFIQPVIDFVVKAFKLWWQVFSSFWTMIIAILAIIAEFVWNKVLKPIIDFVVDAVTFIYNWIVNGWKFVIGLLVTVGTWIWDNVLSPVMNFFVSAFNYIWGIIKGVIDKITNAFRIAKDFIISAFNTVKSVITNIFNGIKGIVSNTIGSISGFVKGPINGIVKGANSIIRKVNSLKVPDWVPGIGGKKVNFPLIPQLATGTNYVPQDMLAMIHKGEAVVPKKFNPYANVPNTTAVHNSDKIIVNVNADFEMDPLGQVVKNIKTFSGGSKNDFNYGMGV